MHKKITRRLLASAALGVTLMAVAAGPSSATYGLPGASALTAKVLGIVNLDTNTTCKTVLVLGKTTPTVTVTIGGKPYTVNTSAFATAAVKVCVQVGIDATVAINANVNLGNPLCPVVTGNVAVSASVSGGGVFVRVDGLDHHGKPLTVTTNKLHLLPAGTAADVPLLIVVCDP